MKDKSDREGSATRNENSLNFLPITFILLSSVNQTGYNSLQFFHILILQETYF